MSDSKNDGIRNLAIIAHVDHGKTTLVDALLKQGKVFQPHQQVGSLIMDTNPLERERGITILAKNASVSYGDVRINLIDTPGHADFSGEVERVMNMADGCLLLVDAVDGPMPQTTYVLRQALQQDVTPMVVINKIDRPEARVAEVEELVQDLFLELATKDHHLDFPVLYTSAKQGYASRDSAAPGADMQPLFESILSSVPPPAGDPDAPLQMLVAALDYDTYVGQVCVGRISSGTLRPRDVVTVLGPGGEATVHPIEFVFVFHGMERVEVAEAYAGDIVAVTGPEGVSIGDTIASREDPRALPTIAINEPTVRMTFGVSTSPFKGTEGVHCSSRTLHERLMRELRTNVSLRVDATPNPSEFVVSGRGELHLSILVETMRREGLEFQVSRPMPVNKVIDGRVHEPVEMLNITTREEYVGPLTEYLSAHLAQLRDMRYDENGHGAHGVHHPHAGAHRLQRLLPPDDARRRREEQRLRLLRAAGGGDTVAPGRRAGGVGRGRCRHLRAAERAGPGRHVHRPGRQGLRGDDRRHAAARGRHTHQRLQGEEADQHAVGDG